MSLVISPLPFRKSKRIPVAFLSEDGTISGESKPQIVYCNSSLPALRIAREKGGSGVLSKSPSSSTWLRFQVGNTNYYPGTLGDAKQLIAFRDYCHDLGIAARSIPAMAFYVMRWTLGGAFTVDTGDEIPWELFPTGARMHAQEGVYQNVYQSDIRAAYLWGIRRLSPVREFRPSNYAEHRDVSSLFSDNPGGFFLVSIRLPQQSKWGICPMLSDEGATIYPSIHNHWTDRYLLQGADLSLAMAVGARVKIHRGWIPVSRVTEPFRAFAILAYDLRSSDFPDVAKQVGNTLWGSFVASGDLSKVTFSPGGRRHKIEPLPDRKKLCPPIGYSVVSALRSRLAIEGLGSATVHAHTDGVISPFSIETENEMGGWRTEKYSEVEILSPSWYKTVSLDGEIVYRTAGRKGADGRISRIFAQQRERMLSEADLEKGESDISGMFVRLDRGFP